MLPDKATGAELEFSHDAARLTPVPIARESGNHAAADLDGRNDGHNKDSMTNLRTGPYLLSPA